MERTEDMDRIEVLEKGDEERRSDFERDEEIEIGDEVLVEGDEGVWQIDRKREDEDNVTLPLPLPLLYERQSSILFPGSQALSSPSHFSSSSNGRVKENGREASERKREEEEGGVERMCWNCGSAQHELRQCTQPRDSKRISKMRESTSSCVRACDFACDSGHSLERF